MISEGIFSFSFLYICFYIIGILLAVLLIGKLILFCYELYSFSVVSSKDELVKATLVRVNTKAKSVLGCSVRPIILSSGVSSVVIPNVNTEKSYITTILIDDNLYEINNKEVYNYIVVNRLKNGYSTDVLLRTSLLKDKSTDVTVRKIFEIDCVGRRV